MDYRKEIDGLRALAVLPVILFHSGFTAFSGGFVGVDIFFVISGYLITSIIVEDINQGSFKVIRFYERRMRRIVPALFFVMLCTLPFAWFWMLPEELKGFSQSLVAVPLLSSNFLFFLTSGYFDAASELKPLLHTWSLAVEGQFYILFPLILMLCARLSKKWIFFILLIIAIVSITLAEWGSTALPLSAFYFLPTRCFEFLIGALLSLHANQKSVFLKINYLIGQLLSLVGLILIFYAIFFFNRDTPTPSLHTLIPIFGASLILAFGSSRTLVGKLLGSKLLFSVGLISYSTYLWHQPLLAFSRIRNIDEPEISLIYFLIVASLILGSLSYKYIELPFRNVGLMSGRRIFIYGFIGSLFFIVIGFIGYIAKGFEQRLPEKVRAISKIPREHQALLNAGGCNLNKENYGLVGCIKGDATRKPKIALVGDSHASALAHELSNAFSKAGISFVQYTKDGCPFAPFLHRKKTENCDKYQAEYLKDFEVKNIDIYILSSRWAYYANDNDFNNQEGGVERRGPENYYSANSTSITSPNEARNRSILNAYRSAVISLLDKNKYVILVYPIPEQGWNIINRASKQMLFGKISNSAVKSEIVNKRNFEVNATFDSIGQRKNLIRIYPAKLLCNSYIENRCASELEGKPLYYDDDHLSNEGARLVVSKIMNFFQ